MISVEYLRECFDLRPDGVLVWKQRPLHHFVHEKARHTWNRKSCGKAISVIGTLGYVRVCLPSSEGRKKLLAHRVVWALHYGAWPEGMLDHVNGIRSDNRISNLRIATHTQNMHNARRRAGRDCPKGVSFHKKTGKWRAAITSNKKFHYLGVFNCPEAAANAYAAAATRLHGEFARTA